MPEEPKVTRGLFSIHVAEAVSRPYNLDPRVY